MASSPMMVPAADPRPRAPHWAVRPGGWDTHAHVFGPFNCYPLREARSYTPPEQGVADYVAMLDVLGIAHGILVQPSVYGDDHSCMLDATARHAGVLFGVIDLDVTALVDSEARRLDRLGVRGMRMRWPNPGGVPWLREVARRLRDLGWHLDLLPHNFAALADVAPHLRDLGVPIMVEAMGHPDPGEPVTSPGFRALLDLARERLVSVKLSHPYHIDPAGLPYPAACTLAGLLAEAAPTQLVWGSDWPHPMREDRMPNDGDLLDLLPDWVGSVDVANAVLVDNARRFYEGTR